jgi:2-oxoacid:acceptor oxidoreductase delta subunit (pyruvate/2-ketoisovalerate family)
LKEKEVAKEYIVPVGEDLYSVNTGDWRTAHPALKHHLCTPCGICLMHCPVNAVRRVEKEYHIDLTYCKGCGICAHECPHDAITMIKEENL